MYSPKECTLINYSKSKTIRKPHLSTSTVLSLFPPKSLELALGPENSLHVLCHLGQSSLSEITTRCVFNLLLAASSDDHWREQATVADERQELEELRWWTLPRRPKSLGLPCTASVLLMMECRASSFLSSAACVLYNCPVEIREARHCMRPLTWTVVLWRCRTGFPEKKNCEMDGNYYLKQTSYLMHTVPMYWRLKWI